MTNSMTAFASGEGAEGLYSWSWELRSVNAKGLDIRLRVPDWVPGLEAELRGLLSKAVARGNVTLNLRMAREDAAGTLALNRGQLGAILDALTEIEQKAEERGLVLDPTRAGDLLGIRGMLEATSADQDDSGLRATLVRDLGPVLKTFLKMRGAEGAALERLLNGHLDQIETLTARARKAARARQPRMEANIRTALARVIEAVPHAAGAEEKRVAQELALIAIKSDVTEELDRLDAHIAAARDLLSSEEPVGRRLDFLSQEFNREANTLCSKAQDSDLTAIGLDLKTVIDQMREQVQNVE